MKKYFWRLNRRIKTGSYPLQVTKLLIITYILPIAFIPVLFLINSAIGENSAGPDKSKWIIALLVAPFIETVLFQLLPFCLLQASIYTKNRFALYFILSSILFGLEHGYSARYIVFAFSAGLTLAYTFYLYHKEIYKAFWTTVLVHSLRNSAGLLIFLLSK